MAKQPLVAANTAFAFKLFAELNRQEHNKNIFISPISVGLALSMAYNGARGDTARAIAEALELGGISPDELNRANADLLTMLTSLDPQVTLAIANSLWARQGLIFDPEFLQQTTAFYHAQIQSLDFSGPSAPATINAWVKQHTNGKIEKIVDEVQRDTILFLINAIYFKGDWARPFDQRRTRELPFSMLNGRHKQHPLMTQSGKFDYFAVEGFQAISLPYGAGRLSMYVFLPEQNLSLEDFLPKLNMKNWNSWMQSFRSTEGTVALPRFKLEYQAALNDALKALGMADAFGPRADFSGICASEPHICIDEVRHKTFVEVNEQGTEAAAVTSVGMLRASFVPQRTFSMIVDRPFFCTIRDTQTGALLFIGSIVDPN